MLGMTGGRKRGFISQPSRRVGEGRLNRTRLTKVDDRSRDERQARSNEEGSSITLVGSRSTEVGDNGFEGVRSSLGKGRDRDQLVAETLLRSKFTYESSNLSDGSGESVILSSDLMKGKERKRRRVSLTDARIFLLVGGA